MVKLNDFPRKIWKNGTLCWRAYPLQKEKRNLKGKGIWCGNKRRKAV
jgi:hypothetical protein